MVGFLRVASWFLSFSFKGTPWWSANLILLIAGSSVRHKTGGDHAFRRLEQFGDSKVEKRTWNLSVRWAIPRADSSLGKCQHNPALSVTCSAPLRLLVSKALPLWFKSLISLLPRLAYDKKVVRLCHRFWITGQNRHVMPHPCLSSAPGRLCRHNFRTLWP